MEVRYLGHACFEVVKRGGAAGNVTVVTDPFDPKMVGLALKKNLAADLVLVSHGHGDHNFLGAVSGDPYVVAGPGEYEVKGVKVIGVPTFHDGEQGTNRGKNNVYSFEIDGVNFCHLGDLGHPLSQEQLPAIGKVDVLFVPVGGFYTIDAQEAVQVVTQLEPLVVVPMHYRQPGMSASFAALAEVGEFIKEFGKPSRSEAVLKIDKNSLPPELEIVVLERS